MQYDKAGRISSSTDSTVCLCTGARAAAVCTSIDAGAAFCNAMIHSNKKSESRGFAVWHSIEAGGQLCQLDLRQG